MKLCRFCKDQLPMSPIAISVLALTLMLFGILAGGWVQGRLPEGHLSSDSKEVVKLSMGVMGTLAALVLGLLVASAQSSYAARQSEISQLTAYVILLDHLLDQYGKDAENARVSLRNAIPHVADRVWREGQSATLQSAPWWGRTGTMPLAVKLAAPRSTRRLRMTRTPTGHAAHPNTIYVATAQGSGFGSPS
jgi:hypothetical protein